MEYTEKYIKSKKIKYSTYDHKEFGLMFSIEFPRPGILDMNLYSFFVKKFLLHFVDSIILQLCLLPDRIGGGACALRSAHKGPDVTKLYTPRHYIYYTCVLYTLLTTYKGSKKEGFSNIRV